MFRADSLLPILLKRCLASQIEKNENIEREIMGNNKLSCLHLILVERIRVWDA